MFISLKIKDSHVKSKEQSVYHSKCIYLLSTSRITNSPVADVFIIWAKNVAENNKIRGFILEKEMKGLTGMFSLVILFYFFSVQLFSFFSSPPQRPMTSDYKGFLYQILSIT